MSRVDTAWLRMDNDVNLMMIVGVWKIEPALGLDELRARVAERLLRYDRFAQRVEQRVEGASWVRDDDFDIAHHVVAEGLPRRAGESARRALQRRCGELATTPLDPARPLWQFHLVERHDGGSAMIARIHHCIADGIALISVMLAMTDGGAEPPRRGARRRRAAGAIDERLASLVVRPMAELTTRLVDLAGDGLARGLDALVDPPSLARLADADALARLADPAGLARLVERLTGRALGTAGAAGDALGGLAASSLAQSAQLARVALQVARDAAAIAAMPADSATALKGRPDGVKVVAWNEPFALDEVKAVGRALGGSVNDVLLACAAGAIGEHLRGRGEDPTGKAIRAMVPVNLRPLDQAWKLGNRFGLVPLLLPVGVENPVERLGAVRAQMTALKESTQPLLTFALLTAAGVLPKQLQEALLRLFADKATAVMTNVPGPAQPLKLCGRTLRQTMFWVPASGDIGLGVSILSYAGGVQFGLIADAGLCPDPQSLVDGFAPQFEAMKWLALMLPWGDEGERRGASATA